MFEAFFLLQNVVFHWLSPKAKGSPKVSETPFRFQLLFVFERFLAGCNFIWRILTGKRTPRIFENAFSFFVFLACWMSWFCRFFKEVPEALGRPSPKALVPLGMIQHRHPISFWPSGFVQVRYMSNTWTFWEIERNVSKKANRQRVQTKPTSTQNWPQIDPKSALGACWGDFGAVLMRPNTIWG